MQDFVCLFNIGKIGPCKMPHTGKVIVGMIAYLVTAPTDFLQKMGVFYGILADHKESGLGMETVQGVKNERSSLGNRAVIKSQVNRLLMTIHSPQGMWEKPTQEYSGLLDYHLEMILKGIVEGFQYYRHIFSLIATGIL